MNDKLKNIFEETECPSGETLLSYLDGSLPAAEQHRLEVHMVDCAFCSEALEGYREEKNHSGLQSQLKDLEARILRGEAGEKKGLLLFWQPYLKYAAILGIVLLSFTTLYFIFSDSRNEELVMEAPVSHQAPSVQKQERKDLPAPKPARAVKKESLRSAPSINADVPAESSEMLDMGEAQEEEPATLAQNESKVATETKLPAREKTLLKAKELSDASKKDQAASAVLEETESTRMSSMDEQTVAGTTDAEIATLLTSSSLLDSAIRAYDKGFYIQTINLLGNFSGKNKRESAKANWFLANAYVQTKEYEKARPILEALQKDNASYSRKARKLLDSIQ